MVWYRCKVASHLFCWRGRCGYMSGTASTLHLYWMREDSPTPRPWVWYPILDPNTALAQPWCHPSSPGPEGLVFKWILLNKSNRRLGEPSEQHVVSQEGEQSRSKIILAGKRAARWYRAWAESPEWPALEQKESAVRKQWSQPLT